MFNKIQQQAACIEFQNVSTHLKPWIIVSLYADKSMY